MNNKQKLKKLNKQLIKKEKENKKSLKQLKNMINDTAEIKMIKNKNKVEIKIKGTIELLGYLLAAASQKNPDFKKAIKLAIEFEKFKKSIINKINN